MGTLNMVERYHEVLAFQAREKHEDMKKKSITGSLDELQYFYMTKIAQNMKMSKAACVTEFMVSAINAIMDDLNVDEEWFNEFVAMKKKEHEKEAA